MNEEASVRYLQHYEDTLVYNYFWRTYDQQEIDWIEDRGGQLHAYEFKWNPKKHPKVPVAWRKAYPDATFQIIHPDNYEAWLLEYSPTSQDLREFGNAIFSFADRRRLLGVVTRKAGKRRHSLSYGKFSQRSETQKEQAKNHTSKKPRSEILGCRTITLSNGASHIAHRPLTHRTSSYTH